MTIVHEIDYVFDEPPGFFIYWTRPAVLRSLEDAGIRTNQPFRYYKDELRGKVVFTQATDGNDPTQPE